MHLWSDYIRLHRCLIALIVVFFSVGMGACWEVVEYFYFSLFHPEYITTLISKKNSRDITAPGVPKQNEKKDKSTSEK